jgi:hypothetical protein
MTGSCLDGFNESENPLGVNFPVLQIGTDLFKLSLLTNVFSCMCGACLYVCFKKSVLI